MQRQKTQQLAVTTRQSLQVVQTLLRVSFGCVAYLRDLLPDDNFIDGYLTASGSDSFSRSGICIGRGQHENRKPPSGALKVKTIKKDFSTEGDRLIQYLEEGIFDALEKQYLRSFIFALYLDDENPDNIIEAYTFNFSYYSAPGATSKLPIMTLGDHFQQMALNTGVASKLDPAAEAITKGRSPTLGDVKRSVKNIVKTLMTSTQLLHALPKRRFGTFKLFYLDHVPDDYEPPHFRAGDANRKYFFATHGEGEVPEKISLGSLGTPHHGVEMHLASIAEAITPGSETHDDAACFGDLVNHEAGSCPAVQKMTPAERENMIDAHRRDTLLRKVVWDAEAFANPKGDTNTRGGYDPEYQTPWENVQGEQPRGIVDGSIVEMSQVNADGTMDPQEFSGEKVHEPDSVKITIKRMPKDSPPTQTVGSMQSTRSGLCLRKAPSPSCVDNLFFSENPEETVLSHGIETQLIQELLIQRDEEFSGTAHDIRDSEMLDLETQLPVDEFCHIVEDPIASYPSQTSPNPDNIMDMSQKTLVLPEDVENSDDKTEAEVTQCDCGVPEDEDYGACQCEGPCGRWLHIWYHSVDDSRLPPVFHCFTCRLRNDPQIEVLDSRNLTSEYISKFKDLSFFRRALKIIEVHRPDNVTRFKELLEGSEVSIAGQAWKRLEAEGFIAVQVTESDGIGLLETQGIKSKGKGKKQPRKNLKRAKYVPVPDMMAGKEFKAYFDPMKEARLLGMMKIRPANVSQKGAAIEVTEKSTESQTQLSMQVDPKGQAQIRTSALKRGSNEEVSRNTKRMKISVGVGINLDE